MQSVYDILDPIVNSSLSEREKGAKYEAACVWYLANDPYWSQLFSRVGTLEQALAWEDCLIHDTQDQGIDLVAQEAATMEWWAIQCKCYDDEKTLPKGVCDSFFARALGDEHIEHYMVMTTAKGPGKNLQHQIYTHTAPEWQRRAANELGMLLSPDPDAELCMNCRFWSASPTDATRGVCWAKEGASMPVVSSVAQCLTGDFCSDAA